jgi:hypothetical protein
VVKVSSDSGIELERAAQAIATVNGPALRRYFRRREEEKITFALVVAFKMMMFNVLSQRASQRSFTKENEPSSGAMRNTTTVVSFILVRSKHPLDQCAKRGIIEDQNYDTGKAFITIRDCDFSKSHGRIYNDTGEGDSGIDAATLYTNTWRKMAKRQWELIKLICFAEPKPDEEYFSKPIASPSTALHPTSRTLLKCSIPP